MLKQTNIHNPRGMQKDPSASKFGVDYYIDALNIKLTVDQDNTLLSITNLKGNEQLDVFSSTTYVGHAVLNNYLILFTIEQNGTNSIRRIDSTKTHNDVGYEVVLARGDFNFNVSYPIETLSVYEKESVLKVYWVDGLNQPRVVNIAGDECEIEPITDSTKLDFVKLMQFSHNITVEKTHTAQGTMHSGVIQYAFTYYNLYNSETNVFHTSSLYFASYGDRGGAADDTNVNNAFIITLENLDTSFDYVRIYGIYRSTYNATPVVKRLADFPTSSKIVYIDEGTVGEIIDPTLLQYIGGRKITPYTLELKDNVLFMGNYSMESVKIQQEIKTWIDNNWSSARPQVLFGGSGFTKEIDNGSESFEYSYTNQLERSSSDISIYKHGEWYRFGFQVQTAIGEWSEPVWINDVQNNASIVTSGSKAVFPIPHYTLPQGLVDILQQHYVRIRPLVVYPRTSDRTVICQGVLAPTVFNVQDRATNTPWSASSWFFRPYSILSASLESQSSSTADTAVFSDQWVILLRSLDGEAISQEDLERMQSGAAIAVKKRVDDKLRFSATIDYLFPATTQYPEYYYAVLRRDTMVYTYANGRTVTGDGAGKLLYKESDYWFYGEITPSGAETVLCKFSVLRHYNGYTTTYGTNGAYGYEVSLNRIAIKQIPFPALVSDYQSNRRTYQWNSGNYSKQYYTIQIAPEDQTFDYTELADNDHGYEIGYTKQTPYTLLYTDGETHFVTEPVDYTPIDVTSGYSSQNSSTSEFRHWHALGSATNFNGEIQCNDVTVENLKRALSDAPYGVGDIARVADDWIEVTPTISNDLSTWKKVTGEAIDFSSMDSTMDRSQYKDLFSDLFFVDAHTLTFHSPDIEFNPSLAYIRNDDDLKIKIVGYVPIESTVSDIDIATTTGPLNYILKDENSTDGRKESTLTAPGFKHFMLKSKEEAGVDGMNAVPVWYDELYGAYNDSICKYHTHHFVVYPWHRSGSLNNQSSTVGSDDDDSTPEARSAMLDVKIMSNLRYSANTRYLSESATRAYIPYGIDYWNLDGKGKLLIGKDIAYYGIQDKIVNSTRYNSYNSGDDKYRMLLQGYHIVVEDGGYYRFISADSTPDTIFLYGGQYLIKSGQSSQELHKNYRANLYGTDPVLIRYRSTPHIVVTLPQTDDYEYILPYWQTGENQFGKTDYTEAVTPFWRGTSLSVKQDSITISDNPTRGWMWLAELQNTGVNASTRFGGLTESALTANTWYPAGEAMDLTSGEITLKWLEGDTYYQRYDCLKTYPYTDKDPNQIVDILSFMCETRINIDGRYDRNRGQDSNLYMTPENFNLLNPVYTQKDNYFNYQILDSKLFDSSVYSNFVTWTKRKTFGEEVDTWTNITGANALNLDGDKGTIRSLNRFENELYCFQDKGLSQILYNEKTQLTTTDGVPVEIANSEKVQGKRYISETVGCQNKWSIAESKYGIYFMDSINKTINKFDGKTISDLTLLKSFNSWGTTHIDKGIWTPEFNEYGAYRTYYDPTNSEVYFIGKTEDGDDQRSNCLIFNENLDLFSTFISIDNTQALFNINGVLYSIWQNDDSFGLYRMNTGAYTNFYDIQRHYSITYVDHGDEKTYGTDKVYTNLEFRATVYPDNKPVTERIILATVNGEPLVDSTLSRIGSIIPLSSGLPVPTGSITPVVPGDRLITIHEKLTVGNVSTSLSNGFNLPFDTLETWNEYQKGHADINQRNGLQRFQHHKADGLAALWRKFRIWRCDIPRNNVGINNLPAHSRDRMRNPWLYIKLSKLEDTQSCVELHDLMVNYYI